MIFRSEKKKLAIFYLQVASYQVSGQFGFSFPKKKRKIDFQDGHHVDHLAFPIGMIFSYF